MPEARGIGAMRRQIRRRRIKQETGKSLSQHLMKSPLNMDELAWRVGYTSAPHFCTVFKKETGKTTTEFAQSLGQPAD